MPMRRCSGEVDQKDAAERPERLAAERLFWLLIDNDDLFLCVDQFRRGNEPGKSGTDDNYVRVKGHRPASPGGISLPLGNLPTHFGVITAVAQVFSATSSQPKTLRPP